jgi:cell division protein FtsB
MLKDKLKRARQRNDQLAAQVKQLQTQLEGREVVESDDDQETPLVFREAGCRPA